MTHAGTCCVCGRAGLEGLVLLWDDVYACRRHSRTELVGSLAVKTRLTSAETSYHADMVTQPGLVVWATERFSDFEFSPVELMPQLVSGVNVLMVPEVVVPGVFAVSERFAQVLMVGLLHRTAVDVAENFANLRRARSGGAS